MNSIRFKFTRGEEVRYISHLDLMRTFERAIRRSGLPVVYSQGFNPHPQLVFGLPLSVGVTSEAEYADIELEEDMDPRTFMTGLNNQLPAGIRIVDAASKHGGTNIMASIVLASYRIEAASQKIRGEGELQKAIGSLLDAKELMAEKEGKQGIRLVDIRPMIKELSICGVHNEGSAFSLSMVLSAGSKANLKPELLAKGLNRMTGMDMKIIRIHRIGLFVESAGKAADPLDRTVLSGGK